MKRTIAALLMGSTLVSSAWAEPGTVSRAEYDTLKKKLAALEQEVDALGKTSAKPANAPIQQQLDSLREQINDGKIGDSDFLLAGSASAGFSSPQHGNSNFETIFEPVFLWQINKDIAFEGELEVELEDSDTETKLEFAHITYAINDNMLLGAGKFLSPINMYVERYNPGWINKLPDSPLAVYDGLLPESVVGVQLRGAVPIADQSKITYAVFMGNGPKLNTEGADSAGTLEFDNFSDSNHNKSFGGRIGIVFSPELEVGYGLERARVGDSGSEFGSVDALLQTVDFDASTDSELLAGRLGLRGQYAFSSVDDATYAAEGDEGFGPLSYNNDRNGGYIQASYRPTHVEFKWLRDVEFVTRYDQINQPSGIEDVNDENRVTLGLDYWIEPNAVVKAAYEFDRVKHGEDNDRVLAQLAVGF